MSFIQVFSITGTTLFLCLVFKLIMKKKLREEFSIIWIICACFLLFFSFWRNSITVLAHFFGIYYPPAILFIFLFIALIFYVLHLSIIISKHRLQIKNLTQELAILSKKIDQLEKTEKIITSN
jgi:hypothetical protein